MENQSIRSNWQNIGLISGIVILVGAFLPCFPVSSGLFYSSEMYSLFATVIVLFNMTSSGNFQVVVVLFFLLLPIISALVAIFLNAFSSGRKIRMLSSLILGIPWLLYALIILTNSNSLSGSGVGIGFWTTVFGIIATIISPVLDTQESTQGNAKKSDDEESIK